MAAYEAHETWPQLEGSLPARQKYDFCRLVWQKGIEHYRDLPWRRTRDPYAIWLSEVMLQQTQVSRVDGRWQRWLQRFPTLEALAMAPQADVLEEWQGMGYNRRALALCKAAGIVVNKGTGFPSNEKELLSLPGIGPATAAGIRAFAFNLPGVYLETNVRTVFLHELFPNEEAVSDKRLVPYVEASCPNDDVRGWYYALLDYGAYLTRTVPNPSRRSRAYVRQSRFEGSHRQKRAAVVRMLLNARPGGISSKNVADELGVMPKEADDLLEELAREGFCHQNADVWCA